jgi:hypothetical protein
MEIVKTKTASGKTTYNAIRFTTRDIKVQSRTKAQDFVSYFCYDAVLELVKGNRCFRLSIDSIDCGRISKTDFNFLKGIQNDYSRQSNTRIRSTSQESNQTTREENSEEYRGVECSVFDPHNHWISDSARPIEQRRDDMHSETSGNLGLVLSEKKNDFSGHRRSELFDLMGEGLRDLKQQQLEIGRDQLDIAREQQEIKELIEARIAESEREIAGSKRRIAESEARIAERTRENAGIRRENARIRREIEEIDAAIKSLQEQHGNT